MAKLEIKICGNYEDFITHLKDDILNSSMSASLEEESYTVVNYLKIAVMAFERYSVLGGNRVAMTVTIVANEENLSIIGISIGGSQAFFEKFMTVGETNFLNKLQKSIDTFISKAKI